MEGLDAKLRSLDSNLDVRRRNGPCSEDKTAAGPGAASSHCIILPPASIPKSETQGPGILCGLASVLNPAKMKDFLFPKSLGRFLPRVSVSHHRRQPGYPCLLLQLSSLWLWSAAFLVPPSLQPLLHLRLLWASSLSHILEPHLLGSCGVLL